MVHPSGKQLSIVARTYYEYLLDAAKKFVEQNTAFAWGTFDQHQPSEVVIAE